MYISIDIYSINARLTVRLERIKSVTFTRPRQCLAKLLTFIWQSQNYNQTIQ